MLFLIDRRSVYISISNITALYMQPAATGYKHIFSHLKIFIA